jgi:hypothetical protein
MFPMLGLFLFFIPLAGFVGGIVLCFSKPLRLLAPFSFLVPVFSSYGAIAGFWGLGIWLEILGLHGWPLALSAWLGLILGGVRPPRCGGHNIHCEMA